MTPRQRLRPSSITEEVQIMFKLLLLENARLKLERELRRLSKEAFEEVQGFLSSSHSISAFGDLAEALDVKWQAFDKLTALLKDQTLKTRACVTWTVKNGMRAGQPHTLREKQIISSDVRKFGPLPQNLLTASSITNHHPIRVLGSSQSNGRLNHFLSSQPTVVEEKETVSSISSSHDSAVVTTNLCCHLKAEETETEVVLEVKCQPDAPTVPPAIIQSHNINDKRPPLLLPPINPETNNPKPKKRTPPVSWGCNGDVQVQHQKQTSSQLLHFLRAKAKNTGPLEVTGMECSRSYTGTSPSASPQSAAPPDQTHGSPSSSVADHRTGLLPPKTLFVDTDYEGPIFRVKRIESNHSRTYTCVIASKNELWDVGQITTEAVEDGSEDNGFESTDCTGSREQEDNSHKNFQCQTLKSTFKDPEHKDAEISINIPKFQFLKFYESEVVVSHIVSPGSFYIQHTDYMTKLQAVVTDSCKPSRSYAEQNRIPDIGTRVMGWFAKQEQWCRVEVTKICGVCRDNPTAAGASVEASITVEVKRLDHGDTGRLSVRDIKELTQQMADVPLQAMQVSLANVTPVNGKDWSEEAVGWFRAVVHNRTLFARFYTQESSVEVELFLEKESLGALRRGASVSVRLAQNRHAIHSQLKNAGVVKQSSNWEKHLISHYAQYKL